MSRSVQPVPRRPAVLHPGVVTSDAGLARHLAHARDLRARALRAGLATALITPLAAAGRGLRALATGAGRLRRRYPRAAASSSGRPCAAC